MDQEKIGKFISQCRKEKNITQEELANKLGVTNRSVSRWEHGVNMPDYSILKELCSILDIDVNELLSGEKIEKKDIMSYSTKNLDMILKEYYKMKKRNRLLRDIFIVVGGLGVIILSYCLFIWFLVSGFNDKYDITTNINEYKNVIGISAKGIYKDKWGLNEDIFPNYIDGLDIEDFKMVYYNPWDANYLAYLVVNYNEEEYNKEISRLNSIGIDDYKGIYSVTGFTNYDLVAMDSHYYNGFIYAITDGKSKIIYVELQFCNYYMDIKYEEQIPNSYLPDGFNALIDNDYSKKMFEKGL